VFLADFATQWASAWYFSVFVKNRNPFWYSLIAAVVCFFSVFLYACNPQTSLALIFMIGRRVHITSNIHAMILSPIEVEGRDLAAYRQTQYNWHTFTWLCAPMLFLWYWNMILLTGKNILSEHTDVHLIEMTEV